MEQSGNHIFNISNLQKYYGDKKVLNGINIKVKKGEIIGYIGANGAGKSTTVKIILGLISDYSGSVEIFGEKISSRIILINDGHVVADGAFEDLKATCKEGSLENIFNQLTGFNKHEKLAQQYVNILNEV